MLYEWAQAIGSETLKKVKSILGGTINIDKLRRAVKLLSLPHELPEDYPLFEKFLKEQPEYRGVSKLKELWRVYPDKSSSSRLDPVYRFNYLFEKVEAKLYGEDINLCWDKETKENSHKNERGMVFLNYPKTNGASAEITSNCSDPTGSNCSDPSNTNDHDLVNPQEKEQ